MTGFQSPTSQGVNHLLDPSSWSQSQRFAHLPPPCHGGAANHNTIETIRAVSLIRTIGSERTSQVQTALINLSRILRHILRGLRPPHATEATSVQGQAPPKTPTAEMSLPSSWRQQTKVMAALSLTAAGSSLTVVCTAATCHPCLLTWFCGPWFCVAVSMSDFLQTRQCQYITMFTCLGPASANVIHVSNGGGVL